MIQQTRKKTVIENKFSTQYVVPTVTCKTYRGCPKKKKTKLRIPLNKHFCMVFLREKASCMVLAHQGLFFIPKKADPKIIPTTANTIII